MEYKFLVIGDVMLDVYEYHDAIKISPEKPVPVLQKTTESFKLGGAANVALHIANASFDVHLVGLIGCDKEANCITQVCRDKNIDAHFIVDPDYTTVSKKRILADTQQLCRVDREGVVSPTSNIGSKLFEILESCDIDDKTIVLISDYDKSFLSSKLLGELVPWLCNKAFYVSADTKKNDFSSFSGINLVTPNYKEFTSQTAFNSEKSLEANSDEFKKLYNLGAILITLSEHGLKYINSDAVYNSRAVALDVHDVTGAGDTVFAFWSMCKAFDFDIETSLQICNFAAALTVQKLGTYAPSFYEVLLQKKELGILSREVLGELGQCLRGLGKKIVATNGCFDLLHPGHLDGLEFAAGLGDLLIVGLNSDLSVRNLKGNDRPILPFEDRARMLEALKCVDLVVSIDEDPTWFYEALSPDYLVKGSEYKNKEILGAEFVESYGGKVVLFDRKLNISTTALLDKLN